MRNDGKKITTIVEKLIEEYTPYINKAVEKYFPKKMDLEKMIFTCGKPTYEYDIEAVNKGIHNPGRELIDRGGKRWRPVLMILIIEALGKKFSDYLDFIAIPEIIHNGTLIIDDIEDNSILRRGKPTIHILFGTDIAINAGNTMYYVALLPIIKLRDKYPPDLIADLYEIYIQEMINISYGQGTDIYWHRGSKADVSVDMYLQMAAYKTGTLARMSAKIGAKLAGGSNKIVELCGEFAENIAVAFQIQDDILNLQKKVGKEFGEDIKEGKRSLIVIRALEKLQLKDKQRLLTILDKHTNDHDLIREAINIIKSTDAFEFSRSMAKSLVKKSWEKLKKYLPESEAKKNLGLLANYLIQRTQ